VPSSILSVFVNGLFMAFLLICRSSSKHKPFTGYTYYKFFPFSVASIFTILIASFDEHTFFILIKSKLSVSFPLWFVPFVSSEILAYHRSCDRLLQLMTLINHASVCPQPFITWLCRSFRQQMESSSAPLKSEVSLPFSDRIQKRCCAVSEPSM